LFAIYPVLFLYSSNIDQTSIDRVLWPLLISLAVVIPAFYLLNLFLKDIRKSAFYISAFLVLFYGIGHIHSFIYGFLIDYDWDVGSKHKFRFWVLKNSLMYILLAISPLILWLIARKYSRTSDEFKTRSTEVLNKVSLLLIILSVSSMFIHLLNQKDDSAGDSSSSKSSDQAAVSTLGYLPDIYYIILDGYARNDIFNAFFGFDNTPWEDSLKVRGFQIPKNSRSNYEWTFLSISSSLNWTYHDSLAQILGPKSNDYTVPYEMIANNKASEFLRNLGYRILHINSTWGATIENPMADKSFACKSGIFSDEFYRVMVESSALRFFSGAVGTDLANCHLQNLKTLKTIARSEPGPKFVFSHFVPPHHPYLFDREGNVLRNANVYNQFEFQKKLWKDRKAYLDQALFISRQMTLVIDSIKAQSSNPPVIILHSDHGVQLLADDNNDHKHFHFARLANFISLHTPDGTKLLSEDQTPVNLFPLIFNQYFNANIPIQPDNAVQSGYFTPYLFHRKSFDEDLFRKHSLKLKPHEALPEDNITSDPEKDRLDSLQREVLFSQYHSLKDQGEEVPIGLMNKLYEMTGADSFKVYE
jgi:hypothetical protein